MFFTPLIKSWRGADPTTGEGITLLANDLGLPVKNVRRWVDVDSIPADWFCDVARAARSAGHRGITEKQLAAIAKERRLAMRGDVAPQDRSAA